MNIIDVDVAVIGAGSAGLTAYRAAKSHGVKVLLIERGPYGTTCARVGCMPSKLLIAAADAAYHAADAAGFGVHAGPVRIDGTAVMARVRTERDRFVGFVVDGVEHIDPIDRLVGSARFLGPQQLQVDAHTIVNAARIVIATGSSPRRPAELLGLGDRLIDNEQLFDWTSLPASVAVLGAGVVGLELGQALHRLGVRVALFGRGEHIGPLSDPEVLGSALDCLGGELDMRLGNQRFDAQRDNDGVLVQSAGKDGVVRSEHFSLVLAAAGRAPNLADLQLDRSGLTLDAHGVPLFDRTTMQCGSSTIFIAGDVDAELPLLHEAVDQGRIAGSNAGAFPDVAAGLRRTPLGVVFCDPQIALVGQRYSDLVAQKYAVGSVAFADQGRSRVMRQNRGLLRLYAERGSGRLLGAEMVGPRAEHLSHLLAWACQSRMTVTQMLDMPFYHPVIEEGIRTALRRLQDQLDQDVADIEHCADCTPGM
ncbi:dihydrolipoyl dehydrogenase [Actimicrobium sp. CCC2.4]|uniref:dihydrolipoyl dehydrogenase n=1 Tax=Actimicrobium sp. CCC2.4 TaxID=3048606 RepID=UPI002AC91CC2|nr:dihydrolipoyl dehydrogenase [Actimicrobium sp. CCC2.4]MEB0137271.1 dihydrolipoyl dehydrogenase [Actimicrobium sp. CCC2.4]WPX32545.1 dihydrolipoyl dehydrogenase [Actimicrobium sp. CCC2.4]